MQFLHTEQHRLSGKYLGCMLSHVNKIKAGEGIEGRFDELELQSLRAVIKGIIKTQEEEEKKYRLQLLAQQKQKAESTDSSSDEDDSDDSSSEDEAPRRDWKPAPVLKHAATGRRVTKIRGQIDHKKFEQLMAMLVQLDELDIRDALTVMFGATLRTRDVRQAIVGDIHLKAESGAYMMALAKRPVGAPRDMHEPHLIQRIDAIKILEKRIKNKEALDYVFPEFDRGKAGNYVKQAAQRYNWPANLTWDGTYVLRHGGAGAARRQVSQEMIIVMQAGQWKSMKCADHYSRRREEMDL